MITLNMDEASVARTVKNAALLSPCHNQSSRLRAVFCGTGANALSDVCSSPRIVVVNVLDLFFWRAMFAP
jgi:hypothetical protein